MSLRGVKDINFDVRFLALTNRPDMDEEVRKGRFRKDLLDRLKTCHIHIPPLCDRREDIPELTDNILTRVKKEFNRPEIEKIDDDLMERMHEYRMTGKLQGTRDMDQFGSN